MKQFEALFNSSKQGMYLYLDDEHCGCNAALAKMTGYKSADEWAKVGRGDFMKYVDPKSQKLLVDTYQKAMKEGVGAQIPVTWVRKDGKTAASSTILVPYPFEGHRFALHFISPS